MRAEQREREAKLSSLGGQPHAEARPERSMAVHINTVGGALQPLAICRERQA